VKTDHATPDVAMADALVGGARGERVWHERPSGCVWVVRWNS
jgi:hypothetical protein